ncbi:hypothetical protein EU546_02395 [Candidatus Thorarchaeota archaeon]|nr:MAG: hypothetical protein EU546_02395 [Candidatus Thorarchaeota archaeon]
MEDRYSDTSEYPKRGRYGDPTQRCAWCGRETDWIERHFFAGSFRRNYCSFSCRAAGDLYVDIAILVVLLIILQFPIGFILSLPGADHLLLIGWLFVIAGPFLLCLIASIVVGVRERRREQEAL